MTETDLARLRAACDTPLRRALLEVWAGSGRSVAEVCAVDRDGFDPAGTVVVPTSWRHGDLAVRLSDEAAVAVSLYLAERTDDEAALFVTTRRPIRRLSRQLAWWHLERVRERAEQAWATPGP